MTIIVRLPWTRQPQFAPRINRGNPLTAGLQMLLVPAAGALIDVVRPSRVWTSTNSTIVPSLNGSAARLQVASSGYWSHTGYPEIAGAVGTFFLWAPRVGPEDTNGHLFLGTNTGSNVYFQRSSEAGLVWYAWGAAVNSGIGDTWYSTANSSCVLTSDGTNLTSYVRGVVSRTGSGPTAFPAGDKAFRFGAWIGGSDWDVDADIVVAGYSSRPWSASDARSFHNNPWQLCAPRRIVIPVAVAGSYTHPTLSNARMGSITSTTGVPLVDYAF